MVIAERTAVTMTTSLSLCARIRDLADPEARLERFEVERKAITWWVYDVKRDDMMKFVCYGVISLPSSGPIIISNLGKSRASLFTCLGVTKHGNFRSFLLLLQPAESATYVFSYGQLAMTGYSV